MRLQILRSSTQYIYTFCMNLKQPFFPYTPLTGWFKPRQGVYCAVRTGSLTQLSFSVLAFP